MYFRSTGLGKTELTGKVNDMQRQGDYIVMYVDITDPVKWKIRAALSFRDLVKIAGTCAKAAILSLVFSPKQWRNNEPRHPGEFWLRCTRGWNCNSSFDKLVCDGIRLPVVIRRPLDNHHQGVCTCHTHGK